MDTILILGDSTSMTIGFERKTYPFILAEQKNWSNETEIVNCSQPGFTSSDACAFFFRHIRDFSSLKGVIIYLGNCDANATEIKKGRYTVFQHYYNKMRELLGFERPRSTLKNRLRRFEWDDAYDLSIERQVKPSDYEFNLYRIIRYCKHSFIPVLLIRPTANLLFPSGTGKGNFIFYRYLDFQERFSSGLSISDGRFIDAFESHEKGEHLKALELYKKILEEPHSFLVHPEYILIVANNYAVCAAEAGRFAEAEKLLQLLLKERHIRKEILLFNIAQLFKMQGNIENYRKVIKDAYEADSSLYRIKDLYMKAIDRIALKFQHSVRLIDMSAFTRYELFIDHCHLLPEGQKVLTEKIIKELIELKIMKGYKTARIRNILYNPELSLGNTAEFYNYYKTYAPYDREQIKKDVNIIKRRCQLSNNPQDLEGILQLVSKETAAAIKHYLKHPCFPSIQDILHFGPQYPSDIGRFPEFFLIRHIVPYLRMTEREPSLNRRFSADTKLLHSSSELMSVLPDPVAELVLRGDSYIDQIFEMGRIDRILAKVKTDLLVHLRSGNQIYERIKTTIFWYFRETLRWGSHSRISMRYDRLFLEYAAEALMVAGVLDLVLGSPKKEDILLAITWVEEADRIHSRFAGEFSLEKDCRGLLKEYDGALLNHAYVIEKT